MVSGLKINLHKSNLFDVGVSDHIAQELAVLTGCRAAKLPFIYLGLPVGDSMSRSQGWRVLVDKMKERLSRWKLQLLSIGGRMTLIKSVLGSLGTYYKSLFRLPLNICTELERLRSRFFWGVDEG